MIEEVKLLSCPFCGAEAIVCGNNEHNPRHWVMCRECHACPQGDLPESVQAIAAWNTRASQAEIERLREALAWVRKNYAGGSTSEINARIDAALSEAKP